MQQIMQVNELYFLEIVFFFLYHFTYQKKKTKQYGRGEELAKNLE